MKYTILPIIVLIVVFLPIVLLIDVIDSKSSKNATICPHCGEPIEYTEEQLNKALDEANAEKIGE